MNTHTGSIVQLTIFGFSMLDADPHHLDEYRKRCNFLPKLEVPEDKSYRENFLKIKDLVLIGGPDDGVITPWQSRCEGNGAKIRTFLILFCLPAISPLMMTVKKYLSFNIRM